MTTTPAACAAAGATGATGATGPTGATGAGASTTGATAATGAFERETVAFHCTWQNDPEVPALVAVIESALAPFSPRPHFGKVFNLTGDQIRAVLPKFDDFRSYIRSIDPQGKFQNEFTSVLFSF